MRRTAILILILALAAALGVGAAARAAEPVTKTEARKLRPDVLRHRVLEQLGEILVEDPRPNQGRPPVNLLRQVGYTTQGRASDVPGLCVIDALSVSFTPTGPGERNAGTPVRADGLSVSHYYAALWPLPPESPTEADERRWSAEGGKCRGLKVWGDGDGPNFIMNDDPYNVVAGLNALARLRARPIPLEAGSDCGPADKDCAKAIAAPTLNAFSIGRCHADGDLDCWEVLSADFVAIKIYEKRWPAREVVRASASMEVIVADALID